MSASDADGRTPDRDIEARADTSADAPTAPTRAPRRRGLAIALALSIVALVAMAIPLSMLVTSRHLWEEENADLRVRVQALTDAASAKNAMLAELEGVEQELATLKEKYSSAVNAGAQGTELVVELEDIVDGYAQCVEAQEDHFDVLRNSERYVASSIAESEASITDYCAEVARAFEEFKDAHG